MKYCNDIRIIADICTHINESASKIFFTDKCDKAFRALEIIFDTYVDYAIENSSLSQFALEAKNRSTRGELPKSGKLSETINKLLTDSQKDELFQTKSCIDFVHFRPLIMSDQILERTRYNPSDISIELREKASTNHSRLIKEYERKKQYRNYDNSKLISSLCRLLYEVRSNLAHYGKTPYGPDLDKSARDERICELVYPVLLRLFEYILDFPNNKLIVYGTLKQGGANASEIFGISPQYKSVKIWGYTDVIDELPYYSFVLPAEIDAELLESNNLKNHFDRLDRFEGNKYKRILVPYEITGDIQIGNIYARNNM